PGAHRIEAERQRPLQHRLELDLLVAPQARVGGASGRVLGDEVLDDVAVELLGHVPDVERDADHVGGPARVPGVLDGAAAARTRPVGLWVGRQRQVHAGDVVPGLDGACGGHSGIHAARHGGQYSQSHSGSSLSAPPDRTHPFGVRNAAARRPRPEAPGDSAKIEVWLCSVAAAQPTPSPPSPSTTSGPPGPTSATPWPRPWTKGPPSPPRPPSASTNGC